MSKIQDARRKRENTKYTLSDKKSLNHGAETPLSRFSPFTGLNQCRLNHCCQDRRVILQYTPNTPDPLLSPVLQIFCGMVAVPRVCLGDRDYPFALPFSLLTSCPSAFSSGLPSQTSLLLRCCAKEKSTKNDRAASPAQSRSHRQEAPAGCTDPVLLLPARLASCRMPLSVGPNLL